MTTIDMRQKYSSDDEENTQEEVKKTVDESEEDNETEEETSTSETNEESEENSEEDSTKEDDNDIATKALETKREALRKEIEELRASRREEREKPLVLEKEDTPDLTDVAEQDVALIEKVLKAKGYVKKDELQTMTYREKIEATKDEWLKEHPEYLPANDPDDKNWNELQTALKLFSSPQNPQDIKKILDIAHNHIHPSSKGIPIKSKATTDAATEKIKATSVGASSGVNMKTKGNKNSVSIDKSRLKGFSDEEINEMFS